MCLYSQQVTHLTVFMLLWLLHWSLSAFHRCYSFSKTPQLLTFAVSCTCFILSWGQFIYSRNEARGTLSSRLGKNRNAFDTEVKQPMGLGSVWWQCMACYDS